MGNFIQTYFVVNWKTTLAGVLLAGIVGLHHLGINVPGLTVPDDAGAQLAMILAALGLTAAKDASTSGVPGK